MSKDLERILTPEQVIEALKGGKTVHRVANKYNTLTLKDGWLFDADQYSVNKDYIYKRHWVLADE